MASVMDGEGVNQAVAEFDGALSNDGSILGSEKADAELPEEFRKALGGKKRPSNWYSGTNRPDVHNK